MHFCETCRVKKNWPDGLMQDERCEVCGTKQMCYDVPSVMLVPEAERTIEQKIVLKAVMDGYHNKADRIVITDLDGRMNHRMTEMVRQVFVYRSNQIDYYATFIARLTVQERFQQAERAKRDRR
jgi:hypothetical protein